ncbi:hypothetical protein SAMN04488029_2209 [Reichenbachiella faecimaris]|uniref:Uncharacterized protein n=1 Tax=Reichenbachiella faecimaris TaxID=692418 RepID=A0A1W2GDY0_REIFA|nr:hypothetical protein [Reichenbachiella faecimaris]SMD34855.1 hypothetical protein SAMN04488029_2209 [Reichenbachiella faecimaris]
MMKYIQYLALSLFLSSCDSGDFFSVPNEGGDGNYNYDSSSIYFDDRGDQSERGRNTGSFDMSLAGSEAYLSIYPRLGWSYDLVLINLTEHTLSNGSVVTSFSIQRNTQYINGAYSDDDEFRVDGTRTIDLEDNGSTIGTYDGLIYENGEIVFEFESINISSGAYTITTINAYLVD